MCFKRVSISFNKSLESVNELEERRTSFNEFFERLNGSQQVLTDE